MDDVIYWLLDEDMPVSVIEPPAFLAPIELARLAKLRFPKRRTEWLHGRLTAKRLLRHSHPHCFNLILPEIIILNEPYGMPYACLPGGEKLPGSLSISHREHLAACALVLTPSQRVGIDIEKIEPHSTSFMEDYFTPDEVTYIKSIKPIDQPDMVTLIWSAKEAVLKALGQGLRQDTRSVNVSIRGRDTVDNRDQGWNRFDVVTSLVSGTMWMGNWRQYKDIMVTTALLQPQGNPQETRFEINLEEVKVE